MKTFLFVLLGALLFAAVMWFAVTHYPDGAGRWVGFVVATALFALCAFGPGRLWGKSNRLNSFVLPLLLLAMQEPSAWWLVPVLLVAALWVIGVVMIVDWVQSERWAVDEQKLPVRQPSGDLPSRN